MGKYASVYFSPNRHAADTVIGFIDRTVTSLDIAVYSITHDRIADAIIRAHQRGVAVRVLMDKTQAGGKYADDERMEAAGIPVYRDRVTGLMHAKYALSDVGSEQRAVAAGSFNWTLNADTKNVEHLTVLRLKYIVDEFQAHFEEIWEANAPPLNS
jgi:phosphatidylserine/phosphatidylglycerophosphate/cardiolipin synthase-like enzyme